MVSGSKDEIRTWSRHAKAVDKKKNRHAVSKIKKGEGRGLVLEHGVIQHGDTQKENARGNRRRMPPLSYRRRERSQKTGSFSIRANMCDNARRGITIAPLERTKGLGGATCHEGARL